MSRSKRVVTNNRKGSSQELPEWTRKAAFLVALLDGRGVFGELVERLRIHRSGGGYAGVDLVLFFLLYMTARVDGGIKGFGARVQPFGAQLAALAGRRRLPAPASVSRLLADCTDAHAEAISEWLLVEGCDAFDVLGHSAVQTRDARGDGWHVFDVDPTVNTLRQRALPEGEDLPEGCRRSHEMESGYPGRKRGDVQVSRTVVQHAGSSLWMGLWMAPGNGDWRDFSAAAVQRVRSICDRLGHPAERALVRVDGAGGNIPFIAACNEQGVRYLSRWSQYGLLDDRDVRVRLNNATWFEVKDSQSGPRRQAADLGWTTLLPSPKSVRDDGSSFAPVRSRIVVSRFAQGQKDKQGAGVLIDGWQYEMFVTDLPADRWTSDETVTEYYRRTSIENRFAQEDRELGLDQIFSYHIPGQQLATLVGLTIWNVQTCRGFDLADLPPEIPAQPPRTPCEAVVVTTLSVTPDVLPIPPLDAVEPPTRVDDVPQEAPASAIDLPELTLAQAMTDLDWRSILGNRPDWTHTDVALICPNGAELRVRQALRPTDSADTRYLRFRGTKSACRFCTLRAACTDSESPAFRKEIDVNIDAALALRIQAGLERDRNAPHRPPPPPKPRQKPPGSDLEPLEAICPGSYAVTPALLLPARLRRLFAACDVASVQLQLRIVPPPKSNPYFAISDAQRQQRRHTWAKRTAWNAFDDRDSLIATFEGSGHVEKLLHLWQTADMIENAA